jgi:hypothetical protein
VVDFEEYKFKGILAYEEVLQKFPNDTTKQELEYEQEKMKRVTIDQYQRLLQQEQDNDNIKEQEKARKEEKLEQKRLQAEKEYQRRQDEEERIKRENELKVE